MQPRHDDLEPMIIGDWRRRMFELYARVRADTDPQRGWTHWRDERDRLFAGHPATPLPVRPVPGLPALDVFGYDPAYRVLAEVRQAPELELELATSDGGSYAFTRFALAHFELAEQHELELYWLHGYAGGLFVPFTDATCGESTYGAGRYLLDTVKGADLGTDAGRLVLDFNFAYNPSCSYDPAWSCPLASGRNRLATAVQAGERRPPLKPALV